MKPWTCGIALAVTLCLPAVAQRAQVKSTYLLRIERLWQHQDVCLLVNRDGAYRLEKIFPGKTVVSAGILSVGDLNDLHQLLDADSLRNLTQDAIGRPILGVVLDQLKLSIGRDNSIQELLFADEYSRQPFRAATDPLVRWFNRAQELSGSMLDESSASSCMPPPQRSPTLNSARQYSWVIQFTTNEMFTDRAERTCSIIYENGKVHRERLRQKPTRPLEGTVQEGELSGAEMEELHRLVDATDLVKVPSQHRGYTSWFQEGQFTEVHIPRPGGIQTLVSSSYYKVERNPKEVGRNDRDAQSNRRRKCTAQTTPQVDGTECDEIEAADTRKCYAGLLPATAIAHFV